MKKWLGGFALEVEASTWETFLSCTWTRCCRKPPASGALPNPELEAGDVTLEGNATKSEGGAVGQLTTKTTSLTRQQPS